MAMRPPDTTSFTSETNSETWNTDRDRICIITADLLLLKTKVLSHTWNGLDGVDSSTCELQPGCMRRSRSRTGCSGGFVLEIDVSHGKAIHYWTFVFC